MLSVLLINPLISSDVYAQQPSPDQFLTGFNVSGIVHYGYGDILQYSQTEDIDKTLQTIKNNNGKLVRVFAPYNQITDAEAARRLGVFLDKADQYDIDVIVCLINYFGTGFNPQGTDSYYEVDNNGFPILNSAFFQDGYKQRYKPFVETVVSSNKHHPNIYAWEVGNELSGRHPDFLQFMQDISGTIKRIDPNHKIATGMVTAYQGGLSPELLYG